MMWPWTRRRKERLEAQWAAEVAAYRNAGGRSTSRPDLLNPFLIADLSCGRTYEEGMWRRAFMAQFDSRTGEYDDYRIDRPNRPSPLPVEKHGSQPVRGPKPCPPPKGGGNG